MRPNTLHYDAGSQNSNHLNVNHEPKMWQIHPFWGTNFKNVTSYGFSLVWVNFNLHLKGVLHLWALFLKTLCIFSKNKATSDKVSYGSGQKCSKELKNYSFTSVETIVVKLQ